MTRQPPSSKSCGHRVPSARVSSLAFVLVSLTLSANAQSVYKITGPDGKVTFSDQAPVAATAATATNQGTLGAAPTPNLPFELRQLASKYPVTLYTTAACGPCDTGRSLLTQRGIPYTEKTVTTNEDLAAFARLAKDSGLPLLTIAGQQIKGFSESEWGAYLDAAGYPKQSALAPSYRPGAPTPLAPLTIAPVSAGSTPDNTGRGTTTPARKRPTPAPVLPQNTNDNPAGIKF